MGLDWNPGQKAKPGHEKEFEDILLFMEDNNWQNVPDQKLERYFTISDSAFETLNAPTVGVDPEADEWARSKYVPEEHGPIDEFMSQMSGFRVTTLCNPCDGLPRYSNGSPGGYVEAYSFRAQFLIDSKEIIGEELLLSAWGSKRPKETIAYGESLIEAGMAFAKINKIDLETAHLNEDPDSIEFKLDVVIEAGKWCTYWGSKGHFLEAYF